MKRNKQVTKVMRRRITGHLVGINSRYAKKVSQGRQLYGPGCCAHRLSLHSNQPLVAELRAYRRFHDESLR